MATDTDTSDIQAELHRLRLRNKELLDELEKVKHDRDTAVLTSPREDDNEGEISCSSSLDSALDNKDRRAESFGSINGLHQRRIASAAGKDNSNNDNAKYSRSSSSGRSPRRAVKSKTSDVSPMHSPINKGQLDFAAATSAGKEEPNKSGPDGDDDFNNEFNDANKIPKKKKSTKTSSDGGGRYFKAMSIDTGDEEGQFRHVHVQNGHDLNNDDGDDSDDDDESHNKHFPGTLPSSPSVTTMTGHFPSFRSQLKERAGWLIGLLFLQSCSSFIIQYNEIFLQNHMVLVQFLTMLVGAGGNAGNQASVGVIRSLAIGTLNRHTMKPFLKREAKMAVSLAVLIGTTGFIRAAIFRTPPGETIAITTSVFAIVAISVGIGSTLPLAMKKVGIDPAHSSTTIQVIMDILGVLITVCVSSFVLSFKVFQDEDDSGGGGDSDNR